MGGQALNEKTPLTVRGLLVVGMTVVAMVTRALGGIRLVLGTVAVAELVAATEALESVTEHALGAAPHGMASHGSDLIHVEGSDKNLISWRSDELDVDTGNALDKSVADLDDGQLDTDNLEVLLLIHTLGLHRKAVAKSLLPLLPIALDDGCDQVTVPRVGVGIQLETVQGKSGTLHGEIHLDVGVSTLAPPAWQLERLREGRGRQAEGVGAHINGQSLDDVLVAEGGCVGNDKKGGGRRRKEELAEKHVYWRRIRFGDCSRK